MEEKKKRKRIKKVFIRKAYPIQENDILNQPDDDGQGAIYNTLKNNLV